MTSKPDLYPLVFSYTNDGGKNGGRNYLMVQYFHNYIVRPIGSLSVDSISSSFICTANEANTQIPPPYSSASDLSVSLQNYNIPRSASQQVILNETVNVVNDVESQRFGGFHRPSSVPNTNQKVNALSKNSNFHESESVNFTHLLQNCNPTPMHSFPVS